MLNFDDVRTGQNLAFFGSNDDENWVRIGAAVRAVDGSFGLANGELLGRYRWIKMESEPHALLTCQAKLQGSEA